MSCSRSPRRTIRPTCGRRADWVRLAGLYGKIAETELENDALEKAAVVYAALDPPDRARLEPDETAAVESSLNRSRAARRSRRGLREPLDTRSAVLGRIAAILRGDFQHLLDYPETLVQQVHNGLAPFRDSRPVEPLLTRLGAFLDAQDRAWCEICGVLGPGRDGWLQRQLSTTTQFPADVRQLSALPDGRLLAFADDSLGWLARPGETPSPMAVLRPPRKGRQAVATVGWRMAWIDEREDLFFFQVDGSVLRSEGGAARPRARLVAPHDAGFIAVFADGRVVRFDARGEPTATVTAPAIERATQLLPWRDGTRAAVVMPGAARPGAQGAPPDSLRIVTFEPADAGQPATLPPQVRSIEHSWNAGELLVGSIDGLRCWRIADALPKGSGGSTDNIVRSNAGAFTAMHQGSIRVIHHEAGLQAMLPTPADALVAERLVFEDRDGESALHVLTGAVVDTWDMRRVFWRPSVIVGWIEQASFSPDGNELIALSPVGTRFLWETERGTLLEQEPFDPTEHMIAWAASGDIGATCHDGMVEIVDGAQRHVAFFNDRAPTALAWDHAGRRLAWTGVYDKMVRWAERTSEGFRHSTLEDPERHPRSPALSPDGRWLAYVRHYLMPNIPEAGISVRMGVSGRRLRGPAGRALAQSFALVDLDSSERRIVRVDTPGFLERAWFVSNCDLLLADDAGCVTLVEVPSGAVAARFRVSDPVVGGCVLGDRLRLCDSGRTAVVGPIVYDVRVKLRGRTVSWV